MINRLSEAAVLLAIGLYVLIRDISKTMMMLDQPEDRYLWLMYFLLAALIFRYGVLLASEKSERNRLLKYVACALVICAVYFMIYRGNPDKNVAFLAVMTLASIGTHYIKVLKVYIAAAVTALFPAILMAWIGAIENLVYIRDVTIRSSWGARYPTDLVALLFFLLLAVWIVFRETDDLWFLIPSGVLLIVSAAVADSRTGMICDALLIAAILMDRLLNVRPSEKIDKVLGCITIMVFPLFTILTCGLMYAYRAGIPVAGRINDIMSGRLELSVNALNKHGLSLFGKELDQVGWGGTTFAKQDYSFVDISYILILLQFGIIALIMINIIWVLMTRKAVKLGDRRLMLVLGLIAFNGVSEHHIAVINYNILLAVPFTVLAVKQKEVYESDKENEECRINANTRKEKVLSAAAFSAIAAVVTAVFLMILPMLRTAVSLVGAGDSAHGRRMLFLVCSVAIWFTIAAIYSMYSLCRERILKKTSHRSIFNRKTCLAILTIFCVAFCSTIIACNMIINKGVKEYRETIESEKEALETIQNSGSKVYVTDLPSIYKRAGYDISSSLYNGEELARYYNTSVLIDKNLDSAVFFGMGFLYTEISDDHALFTDNESVIKTLEKKGYHFTSYYPLKTELDMAEEASSNGLKITADGTIRLEDERQKLRKGPRADLRDGRYTFACGLSLENYKFRKEAVDDPICTILITSDKGKIQIKKVAVNASSFNDKGETELNIICEIPDSRNVDIQIMPEAGNTVAVNYISYQKTPKEDIHSFYNESRIKKKEEYYDREGRPYYGNRGFFCRKFGYDDKGNINKEIYYDENDDKIINASGYCEIKRKYDEAGRVVREEYYGTDGNRIVLAQGQSAEEFVYDENGRPEAIMFYDEKDRPTLFGEDTWGGYHIVKRQFDINGWTSREDFYDTNGDRIKVREGFYYRTFEYDADGNKIRETYFDDNNNKTLNRSGYSDIKRLFNENNQLIREEYYGENNKPVFLPSGQASNKYSYDEENRINEIAYFDINGDPVELKGEGEKGYHRIIKSFDEYGRVVREEYYDGDNRKAKANEGYAARETIYEGTSDHIIGYRYYDSEDKEIRF